MDVSTIHLSVNEHLEKLWQMVSSETIWKLEYHYDDIKVWSKHSCNGELKMIKTKATFTDVDVWLLFDVLMDGEYRHLWDTHMLESYNIGFLSPNNDVGYYAMSCPPPIQNRDFVLQRSWLATSQKISIVNHSVYHNDFPPKKYFIRGISHLTGYVIEPLAGKSKGCSLSYVSATDPRGSIPAWAVNKGTQYFAPKMIKTLHKACLGYAKWKSQNEPGCKPWIYPEQINLPKLNISALQASPM